jgi:hypothetical protein
VDEITADKAGAAGDEEGHGLYIPNIYELNKSNN